MEKGVDSIFSKKAQQRLNNEVRAAQPIDGHEPYWPNETYTYAARLKQTLTGESGFRRVWSLITLQLGTWVKFKAEDWDTNALPLIDKIVNQDLGNHPAHSIWDDR